MILTPINIFRVVAVSENRKIWLLNFKMILLRLSLRYSSMSFKLLLFSLFFFVGTQFASAQVKLMNLDQLEHRVASGKDTVYVVNFWATWCVPCVKELPNFDQLASKYQSQPLKVILMSVDFKSKLKYVVIPFVKRNHIQSEVYLLNEPSQQEYMTRVDKKWSGSLPATLIINKMKNTRNFYEKEFTWDELEKTYLANR